MKVDIEDLLEERDTLVKDTRRVVKALVKDLNRAMKVLDTIACAQPKQTVADATLKTQIASLDELNRACEKLLHELYTNKSRME
ncbi:MAG: hypothetical protein IBV52_04060 [Candidatus Bathyarchaeota archaeon]